MKPPDTVSQTSDPIEIEVHNKRELAAALQSPCGLEETIIIRWYRPTGVTTYRLKPKNVAWRANFYANDWTRIDRHYQRIARKARALNKESCK